MLTAKQLAEFVKSKVNTKTAYMWGEFGRKITSSTISQKAAQYPSRYTSARQALLKSYIKKGYNGCDCAGLYKWFLWTDGGKKSSISYKSATDRSTTGMYNAAVKKGEISSLPEIPGVILYMKGHVGVYIGNGEAVECTLGAYGDGVVKTKVKGRGWTHWLQMPEIDYSEVDNSPSVVKSITEVAKDVINGKYGNGTARKTALEAAGYNYSEVQKEVNRLLAGSSSSTAPAVTKSEFITMTVIPSVGLWLNNSDKKWNTSTHIICMPKGSKVKVYGGSETKLGNYTCVKAIYKSKVGYCAKEYLK